jgi:hypothetical protein
MPHLPLLAVAALLALAAPSDSDAPAIGSEVRVVLADGQELRGRLTARDTGGVSIDVSGTPLTFPTSAVREVTPAPPPGADAARPRDPNRTRYLYSPSAFFLRQGEGYVSQTELLMTSVAVGATDWLTLQAGTVIPVLFYEPTSLPFLLAVKVGGHVGGPVALAAGFQTLVLPGVAEAPAIGVAFATVTLGDEDHHLSVSAGPPFLLSHGTTDLGPVLIAVSGAVRLSRGVALVSENWILPGGNTSTDVLASGAVRLIAQRLGVDVGLVFANGAGVPLPWLDFTWNW